MINLTANDDVNDRLPGYLGQEVCLVGILYVDSAHGSYFELPDATPGVLALYGDRIVVPLRALDALEDGLSLDANQHTLCGVLTDHDPPNNSYRLEFRE